nr:hypothetical protein [Tanacetum cinerariifolium]
MCIPANRSTTSISTAPFLVTWSWWYGGGFGGGDDGGRGIKDGGGSCSVGGCGCSLADGDRWWMMLSVVVGQGGGDSGFVVG